MCSAAQLCITTPTKNIPETPELGTPHYKVVPNCVHFRAVQLYHRQVSVVALCKPDGIVRGILDSYGMYGDKYHSTYRFSGVTTQRSFYMNSFYIYSLYTTVSWYLLW